MDKGKRPGNVVRIGTIRPIYFPVEFRGSYNDVSYVTDFGGLQCAS
jgi:hypothetical protein